MPDFYGTVEEADAYHDDRGNVAWTNCSTSKEAALLRASGYVDAMGRHELPNGTWASLFAGTKVGGRGQLREWPRKGAYDYQGNAIDETEVPIEVRYATYEAALREVSEPGSLSPDYVPSAMVKSQKAGPWEEEYFAPPDGAASVRPVVSIVMDLLAPVLLSRALGAAIMVV